VVVQFQQVYRTPAGSIVRDISKPLALVCLDIVREFLVQPRLRLTATQVGRLWNLSPERCSAVLGSLVKDGYLELESDGRYVLSINKMYRTA
jgi:DNA-binding IclR family transcriptional regulator